MRQPLGVGWRTNDRFGPYLYWHSLHSLTWSWILRVQPIGFVRASWSWHRNPIGFAVGLPRVAYFSAYRTNHGLHWQAHALGIAISWDRQQPVWFRDIYRRAMDRANEAERQLQLMNRFAGLTVEPGAQP